MIKVSDFFSIKIGEEIIFYDKIIKLKGKVRSISGAGLLYVEVVQVLEGEWYRDNFSISFASQKYLYRPEKTDTETLRFF